MSICLVTGSSGLVGAQSSLFFSKKKFKIVGIDNNLRKFFFGKQASTLSVKNILKNKIKDYEHYDLDIRNSKIENIFKKYNKKIKIIIHAAAQPSHDWAYNDPRTDFQINTFATLNLLDLTKKYCPSSVFIFMSTNKVYGDNPNLFQYDEEETRFEIKSKKFKNGFDENLSIDKCKHSFFGSSKLSADIYVQEFGKNIGLKTVCFRAGCITGSFHSGAKLHGFLSYLVKTTLNKQVYSLLGYNGKQVRDNIHSNDLVSAFWEFYKSPKKGSVYNIGGTRFSNCSILEALKIIGKKTQLKPILKHIKKPRIGDHIWYISNMQKFKTDFPNWKQQYNLEEIISEMIHEYSKKS